jgi:hypothetical protein
MGAQERRSKRAKTQRKQFSQLAEDDELAAREDHELRLAIELSKRTRSNGSAKQDPLLKVILHLCLRHLVNGMYLDI